MSTRPSAASAIAQAERKQFAEDLEYYLSLTPRQLPSHYLYDELGSALFEAICRLPWYPITRIEQQLLADRAREIFARAEGLSTLVELGPGSGEKLAALVGAAGVLRPLTVHLVDVSAAALAVASRTLGVLPNLTVVPHQAAYEEGLAASAGSGPAHGRTLTLFLGSNIGNFDPPGADAFLRNIRAVLNQGDFLLMGADLVKPERDLLRAYDDPLGVTAAFNRNLLVRVNRELGADFDIDRFSHRAIWNPSASRIEMHLVSDVAQRVRITASHLEIAFERGETIWTESSYKYLPETLLSMLDRADMRTSAQWIEGGFALTLAEAV